MSLRLKLIVKPHAKKYAYKWLDKDVLKLEVMAAPENNKANEDIIQFLSHQLKIDTSKIRILGGTLLNINISGLICHTKILKCYYPKICFYITI